MRPERWYSLPWLPNREPDPEEVGLLCDLYEGRKRKHMGRQIGFLSEDLVPKVGKKLFPYTPAGKKAASKVATKTGKKMMMNPKQMAKRMKDADKD